MLYLLCCTVLCCICSALHCTSLSHPFLPPFTIAPPSSLPTPHSLHSHVVSIISPSLPSSPFFSSFAFFLSTLPSQTYVFDMKNEVEVEKCSPSSVLKYTTEIMKIVLARKTISNQFFFSLLFFFFFNS